MLFNRIIELINKSGVFSGIHKYIVRKCQQCLCNRSRLFYFHVTPSDHPQFVRFGQAHTAIYLVSAEMCQKKEAASFVQSSNPTSYQIKTRQEEAITTRSRQFRGRRGRFYAFWARGNWGRFWWTTPFGGRRTTGRRRDIFWGWNIPSPNPKKS